MKRLLVHGEISEKFDATGPRLQLPILPCSVYAKEIQELKYQNAYNQKSGLFT